MPGVSLHIICNTPILDKTLINTYGIDYDDTETPKNLDFLPIMHIGAIKAIVLEDCPLSDNSMLYMTNKLGLESVEQLSLSGATSNITYQINFPRNISKALKSLSINFGNHNKVSKEFFNNMTTLTELTLKFDKFIIEENQFYRLTSLKSLYLHGNNIEEIPKDAFQGLKKLHTLHLWSNNINSLENGVFDDLKALRSLELSKNNLTNISEELFSKLIKLEWLNLSGNNITQIPANIFRNNVALKNIRLEQNRYLSTLPNALFANLTFLNTIKLPYCNLTVIPEDIFRNSTNLSEIRFEMNKISILHEKLFSNLTNLEKLNISHNKLEMLPDNIFADLKSLNALDLRSNRIKTIPNNLLSWSTELHMLNLMDNYIDSIESSTFTNTKKLKELDLSHNRLELNETDLFSNLLNLEKLFLNHNNITTFPSELQMRVNLQELVLSNNYITYIDLLDLPPAPCEVNLESNKIELIDIKSFIRVITAGVIPEDKITLHISNNPLVCDCFSYDFFLYINLKIDPNIFRAAEITYNNLTCSVPTYLLGKNVKDVPLKWILCNEAVCPENCSCVTRPSDKTCYVDCISRGLAEVPYLTMPKKSSLTSMPYERYEVYLQNNSLLKAPEEGMGYNNVSILNLSYNKIVELPWVPSSRLEKISLSNNNLTILSDNVLSELNGLIAELDNNPWDCSCRALNFSHFVKGNIPYGNNVLCGATGLKIKTLSDTQLCPNYTTTLYIAVGILFFVSIITLAGAFCCYYKSEVKIWMYSRNLFIWLITEEDVDEDKQYDAFISYSHMDGDYVEKLLVKELESGANPYKICVHTRNWLPGEAIPDQIVESVKNSRRTIVVLSKSFKDSVWGIMEFRIAHTQSMKERRTRLIVIIKDDVDLKNVSSEISAYLNTNTYIKSDDPWFWQKLRYALPHRKKNQKADNMMINIDKMDLINGSTTPNHLSTPPIHPLLLKVNPMLKTPPAEAGNIC